MPLNNGHKAPRVTELANNNKFEDIKNESKNIVA